VLWTNSVGYIKRFHDVYCIITEFECIIVDLKIMNFGGYVFRKGFFKLLNNNDEK